MFCHQNDIIFGWQIIEDCVRCLSFPLPTRNVVHAVTADKSENMTRLFVLKLHAVCLHVAVRPNTEGLKECLPIIQRPHLDNTYRSHSGPTSRCLQASLEVIWCLKHSLLIQRCSYHSESLVNTSVAVSFHYC